MNIHLSIDYFQMSGRTNKHRRGEKSRPGTGMRRSRSASNSPSCKARTVRHVMYVGGGGGNDDDDDHSYCESCPGCNPEGGGSPSSSSSSSSSSEGGSVVVNSAPTPRRAHARTKYVPTYPAYPKQHSFIVDMNNRPLYEVEKKPKSPSRHVRRAKSASPSKQAASGCSLAHLPPATKDNAPYFPTNTPYFPPKKEVNLAKIVSRLIDWFEILPYHHDITVMEAFTLPHS